MGENVTTKDLRIFGIGSGVILIVLGQLVNWRFEWESRQTVMMVMSGIGAVGAVMGLLAPRALEPIYKPWMAGAMVMGVVMTAVLMSVLFIVVVPIFSLIRFTDPLRMRLSKDPSDSYWEPHRNSEPTIDRFSKPF